MTTLIDYIISASILHPAIGAYPPSFSFYLLPEGMTQPAHVPVGGVFGVVSSPSAYHQISKQKLWLYTRFQVFEKIDVRTGEFERSYRAMGERELTADEQAHFERIGADMVRERAAA